MYLVSLDCSPATDKNKTGADHAFEKTKRKNKFDRRNAAAGNSRRADCESREVRHRHKRVVAHRKCDPDIA